MDVIVAEINPTLKGWFAYFKRANANLLDARVMETASLRNGAIH